jgi:hypothetical protein
MPFHPAPKPPKQIPERNFALTTSQNVTDMKKFFCPTSLLTSITLMLVFSSSTFSQIATTWNGGAPGMENEWNCPKNWSNYAVPDAFSNVVIPDVSATSMAPPVIKNCRAEVNTLYMETNAQLTIERGALLVVFDKAGTFLPDSFQPKGHLFMLEEAARTFAGANAAVIKR